MSNSVKEQLEMLSSKSSILLIGLTGGIATGKSTVADFLRDKGAEIIDFDLLARTVVEPGKPALKEITDIFGIEVLNDDGSLNRKKLSGIVFQDKQKRKKLEHITHFRISEEFIAIVARISDKNPHAIIVADIPLLIEVNMQNLFHRIIVVHIPQETQIERLMERDGISRVECLNILNAQIPIGDKLKYADFVIHNTESIKETKNQTRELWQTLKEIPNTI